MADELVFGVGCVRLRHAVIARGDSWRAGAGTDGDFGSTGALVLHAVEESKGGGASGYEQQLGQ